MSDRKLHPTRRTLLKGLPRPAAFSDSRSCTRKKRSPCVTSARR